MYEALNKGVAQTTTPALLTGERERPVGDL